MKIAVLGSTGMAGHVVAQYLQEQGHQVYRASRSERSGRYCTAIDVTDFPALERWLDSVNPDILVNCIGLLQKTCDDRPDLAVLVNSYIPHRLEHKFATTSTRIIHLSTDCVFSGSRGGYREDDLTDGTTMYDRSKALGELKNNKDLTFRMSILGPDIDPKGIGLFNWFMSQRGKVQGWSKSIWNGVTTVELARAIHAAIQLGLTGLYQLVPQAETIDKCSLLELFQELFGKTDISILRVDGLHQDKSLVCTRTDFSFQIRSYREQITDMKAWVDAHPNLYPHYGQ